MSYDISTRMLKALTILEFECDCEDHKSGGIENFIPKSRLGRGIGAGTIAKLLEYGLIVEGNSSCSDTLGYRITEAGRAIVLYG